MPLGLRNILLTRELEPSRLSMQDTEIDTERNQRLGNNHQWSDTE
jgi:hypothetical protein